MKIIALGLLVAACGPETPVEPLPTKVVVNGETERQLHQLGYRTDGIAVVRHVDLMTGEDKGEAFVVERDILITQQRLALMTAHRLATQTDTEQYRLRFLVRAPRTIRVLGLNSGPYALTSSMVTALRFAVQNYNNLDISLAFELRFGNSGPYDIVVGRTANSAVGGLAGQPTPSGDPFSQITLYNGLASFGTNFIEHVATHLIGHCIGLEHTDWAVPAVSCGGSSSPPPIFTPRHIPGTPTTPDADPNSIMMTCPNPATTGEFTRYDRIALEYLY